MIMKVLDVQDYVLKDSYQYFEMAVYSLVSFFIPFFIGHPQIAVGIIVNMMLVLGALNLKGWKILPIIILPSVAVFFRGLMFGPFSVYLIYMIPCIWIGNFILVYFVKLIVKKKIIGLGIGSFAKFGFLIVSAFALYYFGLVPMLFLTAFGFMQLITAFSGGALALGVQKIKKYENRKC